MHSGHGFGPERRIRRRSDFVRVQSDGQRTSTPHFVLLVAARKASRDCADPASQKARIGLVVTKKLGSAPIRNRIKRVCRECFRLWPDFVPNGIELVVIARSGAADLSLADVRQEWERARSHLLRRCASVVRSNAG